MYKEVEENFRNGNLQKEEDAHDSTTIQEMKNLRSANCNAENYLPRIAKHCEVRRCTFKKN